MGCERKRVRPCFYTYFFLYLLYFYIVLEILCLFGWGCGTVYSGEVENIIMTLLPMMILNEGKLTILRDLLTYYQQTLAKGFRNGFRRYLLFVLYIMLIL